MLHCCYTLLYSYRMLYKSGAGAGAAAAPLKESTNVSIARSSASTFIVPRRLIRCVRADYNKIKKNNKKYQEEKKNPDKFLLQ